jgi:general secretion pathway protein G
MKYLSGAKTDTARLQVEDLATSLDTYKLEVGRYPSSDQGLRSLVEAPSGATNWNGPYLKKKTVPKDPWGYEYHYRAPGQNGDFDLYSLGADNVEGGQDENKDVVYGE